MDVKETNWDEYYKKPFKATSVTRKITGRKILNTLRKFTDLRKIETLAELGGSNSAFYTDIDHLIHPKEYWLIDKNKLGLEKFQERVKSPTIKVVHHDLLNEDLDVKLDLCYSVGLIEHFDQPGTKKIIEKHFKMVKSGGYILITFPTPTFLYRITRGAAEALGQWIFVDERPLKFDEVEKAIEPFDCQVLYKTIIWPIFLTQGLILIRKN